MRLRYNDWFSEKWVEYLSPPEWREHVTVHFREVDRMAIEEAGCALDPEVVAGWGTLLRDGRTIPPPVASRTERGTYYLHDGNHRVAAIDSLGTSDHVRVAVVEPVSGYEFRRVDTGHYSTYVLKPTARSTATKAVTSAVVALWAMVALASLGGSGVALGTLVAVLVVLSARYAGWLAGSLTGAACAFVLSYFVFPPKHSFLVSQAADAAELVLVLGATLLAGIALRERTSAHKKRAVTARWVAAAWKNGSR